MKVKKAAWVAQTRRIKDLEAEVKECRSTLAMVRAVVAGHGESDSTAAR